MMFHEIYTWEKLRELERERRARLPGRVARPAAGPPGAPLVRFAGRFLSSAGAGLERWGKDRASAPECCETCG
jgi:hypothetical protein